MGIDKSWVVTKVIDSKRIVLWRAFTSTTPLISQHSGQEIQYWSSSRFDLGLGQNTYGYFFYTDRTLCLIEMINQRPGHHQEPFSWGDKYSGNLCSSRWDIFLWTKVLDLWADRWTDQSTSMTIFWAPLPVEQKRETRGHERRTRDRHSGPDIWMWFSLSH